jgi:hypothetical protein
MGLIFLYGSDDLGSDSFDFPCAIKDNPVKGLNTDSENLVTRIFELLIDFFVTWLGF